MEHTMLENILKLQDQTLSYAVEAAQNGDVDMAKAYMDDLLEFQNVAYLVNAGYRKAAGDKLNEMDTAPREQFILAMEADGIDIEKYGFILN